MSILLQNPSEPSASPPSIHDVSENLPPPRRRGAGDLKHVSPPLSHTRLSRLVYVLAGLTTLLAAYYGFRGAQMQVGEWRRAFGLRSSFEEGAASGRHGWWEWGWGKLGGNGESKVKTGKRDVEMRIGELAGVLGVPVADLAGAVAGVVASGRARETGMTGNGAGAVPVAYATQGSVDGAGASTTGFMAGVVGGMDKFVGLDSDELD
jgi:hypothetical protein